MSRPAASCSAMMLATASRYCSRNKESPSADLNDRPSRLRSNHSGRGYEPVTVVGRIMSRVTLSTAGLPRAGSERQSPSNVQETGATCVGVEGIIPLDDQRRDAEEARRIQPPS